MLSILLRSKNGLRRMFLFFGIIFIIGIAGSISNGSVARAMAPNAVHLAPSSCPSVADPTSQSLLVVLLDRSGSLIVEPGATDPNGYSTSVTKALADLWPGQMAIIPFSGDTTSLPILGPSTLSDPAQRADLKNKIENYPIGGGTPLAAAMHEALNLLKGAPSGSRAVVITDGAPTGHPPGVDTAQQEQDIRTNLISQFCDEGIPVSAFGLTIKDQNANQLLTAIANGTGARYSDVSSPEDLAKAVITLYADWQHLNFTQAIAQGDNFPISIDTFARQVTIVTFRSDVAYDVALDGPDEQPVQGIQPLTDRHYVIDSLAAGVFVAGTYTVHTSGDPDAQVYALVNSPLKIKITAPIVQQVTYGKPIEIDAVFLNGNNLLTPQKNQAQVVAHVKLVVNGRQVGSTNDIVLVQQGATFKGQTQVYNQVGELQIEVDGSYQGVQRETSISLQLVALPPPQLCNFNCLSQKYGPSLIGILIGLVLLGIAAWVTRAVIIAQRNKPKPYGYLTNGKPNGDVELERFRQPVISSRKLENRGNFRFGDGQFELVFDKDLTAKIRTVLGNNAQITIEVPGQPSLAKVTEKPIEIKAGRKIYINGNKVASFETVAGRRWS